MNNNALKEYIKKIIIDKIIEKAKEKGPDWIGNNFNEIINSDEIDKVLISSLGARNISLRSKKSFLDITRGKLLEKILAELLNLSFSQDKSYNHIKVAIKRSEIKVKEIKNLIERIKITRVNTEASKTIDCDLYIYSGEKTDRIFLISVKGTARERIGQFLSHLFIFDDRVLKVKYLNNLYLYEKPRFKYAFVCFDLAKHKDFSSEDRTKLNYKGSKQLEIYLIDDDVYIGGGVYVLNNLPKLNKIGNFSSLVAKIKQFFDEN